MRALPSLMCCATCNMVDSLSHVQSLSGCLHAGPCHSWLQTEIESLSHVCSAASLRVLRPDLTAVENGILATIGSLVNMERGHMTLSYVIRGHYTRVRKFGGSSHMNSHGWNDTFADSRATPTKLG
jgi:hypothetical protein